MSIIIPANTLAAGGYEVENSLRFNKGSSDFLNRTFGTSTGEGTWTYSVWLKISDPSFIDNHVFFSGGGASDNRTQLYFGETTGTLNIYRSISSSTVNLESDAGFRDPSAWYNLCVQNNAGTVAAYMNGVAVTLDGTSLGTNVINKSDTVHKIGRGATGTYTSSYMSEIVFIDGTVVAPTSFGEFDGDSGIWKPIKISGLTFGDNGFYLEFKQVGTSQNSSGLGADTSGNDNHFAVNNLTAVDQSIDTCTNNFCTPNPLYPQSGGGIAFSEGNLKTVYTSYTQSPNGTIGAGAGKWYYEVKMGGTHARFGWCESHCPQGDLDSSSTFPAYAVYSNGSNGLRVYKNVTNRSYSDNSGYTSFSSGKTLGIAFDIDNGKLYAHLNGTYYNSGDPAGGSGALITGITAQEGGLFLPYLNCGTNSSRTFEFNFGSPPHAISSSNADGDGYGNFEYAVPSGFFSINTKNLAEYG